MSGSSGYDKLLPETRLSLLEKSLKQTDSLLHSASEEGLLIDAPRLQLKLSELTIHVDRLAVRTHRAATLYQQCGEMAKGLTCKILSTHNQVRLVLAEIASQRLATTERRSNGQAVRNVLSANPAAIVVRHSREVPTPSVSIPAPSSTRQASGADVNNQRMGPVVPRNVIPTLMSTRRQRQPLAMNTS
ncbi:unnamed protein product [Somion occarium]|uniref:Uncharacterized protein n=1 Tax=Somion occarium TaxID=3059160 RepID=A0ABP1DHU2_9APHY